MANKYTTWVKDKKGIAKNTLAIYLEKPTDFDFLAGQFLEVTLPKKNEKSETKALSIASAPHEPYLLLATRIRESDFKKAFQQLKSGDEVEIEGPYGSFTLHSDPSYKAVFLVGGIGITPVRSIILDAIHRQLPHELTLFYSNRFPEESAFLDELQKMDQENKNFKLIATMTQMEQSQQEWNGYRGYIDEKMIKENLLDFEKSIFYLVGPSRMVVAMRQLLERLKVSDLQIRSEEFGGY